MISLTREYIEVGIADIDKIWHECSFQKHIRLVFFLSAMVNVEGVKTTLKVGGAKHILFIKEFIKDIVFV